MSQLITLELPDSLAKTVSEEARQTGQTIEAILLKRLQQTYQPIISYDTLTLGTTYDVSFPVTDETSAADLMGFWNSTTKDNTAL